MLNPRRTAGQMDKAAVSEKYTTLGQVSTQKNQLVLGWVLIGKRVCSLNDGL